MERLTWWPSGKESACNAGTTGNVGLIPGSGRSPGEGNGNPLQYSWASLIAQSVNNLPAVQEIRVWSLGQEDPLEKEMATHSSVLAWKIPWIEKPGGLQSMGSQRVRHDWAPNTYLLNPWKESHDQPRQHIKKQRQYFANKGPSGQGYGFSSSHVWMWELDYKEIWAPKNWCFWTVVLEKTLESPLDCKEVQPVHPKGD